MRRKRITTDKSSLSEGMTIRQIKKRKPINSGFLLDIEPITENQKKLFEAYDDGKNVVAQGCPGTGKTFSLLYKAIKEVLDETSPYEKVYIIRSLVQTREIGFLPGNHNDKSELFEIPYKNMVKYMFNHFVDSDVEMLYSNLKSQGTISFWSTSFVRGTTFDNCIIIVDEMQNNSAHEGYSLITRVGQNCKIMFSGDVNQSDLTRLSEKNGIHDFLRVVNLMPSMEIINFDIDDVVRSGLVKEFLLAQRALGMI
jgi:phosphate starvation-inducible PhoH-like protein